MTASSPPRYHFITGLPRAGSTLLSALLLQNPRFHAGMTSPVGGLFRGMLNQLGAGSEFGPVVTTDQRRRLARGLFDSYYAQAADAERRDADIAFSDEVQHEDLGICEDVQRGFASGSYVPGRLNPLRETGVHHFHELLRAAYRDATAPAA